MKRNKLNWLKIISSLSLISTPIIFISSKCSHQKNDKSTNNAATIKAENSLANELMKIKVKLRNKHVPINKISIRDLMFYNYDTLKYEVVEPKITIINNSEISVILKLNEIKNNIISQEIELKIAILLPTMEEVLENISINFLDKLFIEKITNNDLHFENLPSNYVIAYANIKHLPELDKVKISFAITNYDTKQTSKEKVIYLNYNEFAIPKNDLDELTENIKPILKNENVSIDEILKLTFDQAITLLRAHKRIQVIDKRIYKSQEKNYINISYKIKDLYGPSVSKTVVRS